MFDVDIPEFRWPDSRRSIDVCREILDLHEESGIFSAALLAHEGRYGEAEMARRRAGYDGLGPNYPDDNDPLD